MPFSRCRGVFITVSVVLLSLCAEVHIFWPVMSTPLLPLQLVRQARHSHAFLATPPSLVIFGIVKISAISSYCDDLLTNSARFPYFFFYTALLYFVNAGPRRHPFCAKASLILHSTTSMSPPAWLGIQALPCLSVRADVLKDVRTSPWP